MTITTFSRLEDRGVVAVSGEQARSFLQGMITCDMSKVGPGQAHYAAFLTSQGRYLHDFFVVEVGGAFLLECEAARAADLARRLSIYRLRSKVAIEVRSDHWTVIAVHGGPLPDALNLGGERGATAPLGGGVAFIDPRVAAAGARLVLPRAEVEAVAANLGVPESPFAAYDLHRLRLGLPDGSRDLDVERSILIESGFDELGGIAWDKGCYLGQELNANSRRLVIRKRLMPVEIEGPIPEAGTKLTVAGERGGEMRSGRDGIGLAMVRVEHLDQEDHAELAADATRLRAYRPSWMAIRRMETAGQR